MSVYQQGVADETVAVSPHPAMVVVVGVVVVVVPRWRVG